MALIKEEYVASVLKDRKRDMHKGDAGKLLIIAGKTGMAGAAILCSRGALRAGAGLVTMYVPEDLLPIVQTASPEAMCLVRGKDEIDISKYDAIAIGPGIGDDAGNLPLLEKLLTEYDRTLVIDADGLNTLSSNGRIDAIKNAKCDVIITPHMGEAHKLIDKKYAFLNDRSAVAELLVEATGAITVLKGADTIVMDKDGVSYVNTTGNPGMATGGTGDVLTGVITALAGQGLTPLDAAKAGVYIHGLAGDLALEEFSVFGMTAMDVAKFVPAAFKKIKG